MRKSVLLTATLASSLIVAGCGGGGGDTQPSADAGSNGSLNDLVNSNPSAIGENVLSAFTSLPSGSPLSPPSLPSVFPSSSTTGLSSQQTVRWSCSGRLIPTDPQDLDQDGVPASAIAEFSCSWQSTSCDFTLSGKYSVKDDDDNYPLSGWDVCTGDLSPSCTRTPVSLTGICSGDNHELREIIDVDLDRTFPGNYNFTSFYFRWEYSLDSSLQATATIEKGDSLSFSMIGDGDNEIFDNGTWNGVITMNWSNSSVTYSCTITANNLRIDENCLSGATAGSLAYTCDCPPGSVNTQMTITVNFSGCGSGSGSYTTCDGTTATF